MRSAVAFAVVLASATAAVSRASVVVYNDFIDPYAAGNVNRVVRASTAAPLMDYNTGLATGITLTIPNNNVADRNDTVAAPATGDFLSEFGSVVDTAGVMYVGAPAALTLDGLSPTKTYKVVFASYRNNGYSTVFTISGADSFQNVSSSGATNTVDSTTFAAVNPNGYVAAFANINPGSDGSVTFTISAASGSSYGYVNAMKLTEAVPEPTSLALLGLGSLALMARRRARA